MKNLKLTNFLGIFLVLISLFYFTTTYALEIRKANELEDATAYALEARENDEAEDIIVNEMSDCSVEEYNKCLDRNNECQISCEGVYYDCGLKCDQERDKCLEYARRIEKKYRECLDRRNNFFESMDTIIGDGENFSLSQQKDYDCKANKIMADCMDEFEGLCKFSWPRHQVCLEVNNQSQDHDLDNQDNDGNLNNNLSQDLIGQPFDSLYSTSPCIGPTPRNSELCPGDDEGVMYYQEKHLVDVCSIPRGSEPKCEYVCQTEHLDDGTCKEYGIFRRFFGFLYSLF